MRICLRQASATISRLQDTCLVIWQTIKIYLRFDRYVFAITTVFVLLFVPLIPRSTENAQKLAAFVNDEPALTMGLEAMTVYPYGNPGNFYYGLPGHVPQLPAHWGSIGYTGFTYYGGAYLDLGFLVFAPLHALGIPTFPLAPMILRTISVFAGLLSLILLYNFAKRYIGIAVGLVAVFVLMTDSYFFYYSSIIHPDTLQLFFGLLAFLVAMHHAEDGQIASLMALGLLCGLVQGTKTGGPWLIPMVLLTMCWGLQPEGDNTLSRSGLLRRYLRRLVCVGAVALLMFFVSTPYAFLDQYYLYAMSAAWHLVSTGLFGKVNF